MAVLKPQKALVVNNQEIYPLTHADQVVMADGTRMPNHGLVSVDDPEFSEDVVPVGIDADTLGGQPATYYTPAYAYCNAVLVEDTTITELKTNTLCPLTILDEAGGFFEAVEGYLVCKKNCIAEVKASLYCYTGFSSGDEVWIVVSSDNNGTFGCSHNYTTRANPYLTYHVPCLIKSYKVGDRIKLQVYNGTGGRGMIKAYNFNSFLTIRIIAEEATE